MKRNSWKPLLLVPLAVLLMAFDKGCVKSPTIDTIVVTKSATIKGNISEYDAAGKFVRVTKARRASRSTPPCSLGSTLSKRYGPTRA